MANETVELTWYRFSKLTQARAAFPIESCIYVQTDRSGTAIRIGKASRGLLKRYWGGNGYAMDAAMHDSGNLVFVAVVDKRLCQTVEGELIWRHRKSLTYNNMGKLQEPKVRLQVLHKGDPPVFLS